MASYQTFTSQRTTEPDQATLFTQLRVLDPTVGIQHLPGQPYIIKKATSWTAPQIATVQNIIDTTPPSTPQLTAQNEIDNWSISQKAFALALIDQLNVIRAALPTPLPPITPAQALAAIRAKAGTL